MAQSMQVIAYDYVLFAYTCNQYKSALHVVRSTRHILSFPSTTSIWVFTHIKPPALLSSEHR